MSGGYSLAVRNARLNVVRDAIDSGAGPGLLRIYGGVRPATGGAPTTLLAELLCSDPCAPDAVNGQLTFSAINADPDANLPGTATWARFVNSDGVFVVDYSVGESGADINLNTTTIAAGARVSITSAVITAGNP